MASDPSSHSAPSSPSAAPSPAFSTLSEATFASTTTTDTLLASPQPLERRALSDGAVEQLAKEREAECAPEGAEQEAQRLDDKLRSMNLGAEGVREGECGCASPVSPNLEGGAFEGLGGLSGGSKDAVDAGHGVQSPRLGSSSPRKSVATTEGNGEFDRFSIPSLEAIKRELSSFKKPVLSPLCRLHAIAPSRRRLQAHPRSFFCAVASQCRLVGESGEATTFGDLVRSRGRVVVVFLRHLW